MGRPGDPPLRGAVGSRGSWRRLMTREPQQEKSGGLGIEMLRTTGGRQADWDCDGGGDACAGARLARLGGVAQRQSSAQRRIAEAEPARGWARQVRDGSVGVVGLWGEVTMGDGCEMRMGGGEIVQRARARFAVERRTLCGSGRPWAMDACYGVCAGL